MITKERLLEILDKSKPEDRVSFYTEIGLSSLILMNLLAVSLESVPSLSEKYSRSFLYFEIFSVIIFGVEYIARIWASSEKKDTRHSTGFRRRLSYIFSFTFNKFINIRIFVQEKVLNDFCQYSSKILNYLFLNCMHVKQISFKNSIHKHKV